MSLPSLPSLDCGPTVGWKVPEPILIACAAAAVPCYELPKIERSCYGRHFLLPECPTELYGNDITLWHDTRLAWAQNQSLPAPVPDDEQVISRFDCPAQARICAHILRFSVVLN